MNRRPAVIGAFILGALGIVILGVLFLGGTRLFATSSEVVVFFSELVAGLEVGAPVTFRGARIGSVKSLAIRYSVKTLSARIPIVLQIDPAQVTWEDGKPDGNAGDYQWLVQAGLRAQLAMQSLITGQLRVDLVFRPDTPVQPGGGVDGLPEIPTVPSDLGEIRNELTGLPLRELIESGRRALVAIEQLSGHVDAELGPVAKDAHETFTAASQTLRTANDAVDRVRAAASTALGDLDLLMVETRQQVAGRGGDIRQTLVTIDRAARGVETLVELLNGLVGPRSASRGDLEATLHDLAASAGSLRGFAQTIERNPNTLLLGRESR